MSRIVVHINTHMFFGIDSTRVLGTPFGFWPIFLAR